MPSKACLPRRVCPRGCPFYNPSCSWLADLSFNASKAFHPPALHMQSVSVPMHGSNESSRPPGRPMPA
eukprot:365987-Chlamydomonas_euryale.AAC.21